MTNKPLTGQYAGFMSRATGLIIDLIIATVVNMVVYWVVAALVDQFTGLRVYNCPSLHSFNLKIITCIGASAGVSMFVAFFPMVYIIFLWILVGQTIGDYVGGVRVVRLNGKRIHLLTALIRLAGYFLCFVSFGLGFLWVLLDDRRQGWHDKLAKTVVIYSWEARQNYRMVHRFNKRLAGKTQKSTAGG